MELEPKQLIAQAQAGDSQAATEMIELYYKRIFAFLRRLSANDEEAADLTQRTFSRVWNALPTFAGSSSLGSWIHGIAYHVYVDWRRANHRAEPRSTEWWSLQPDARPGPDELAAHHDAAVTLYAQVDQLEPDLRDTVHLHYYQGLTLQETAETMGLAVSTVKYRLRQALNELQKHLTTASAPLTRKPALVSPFPGTAKTPSDRSL